MSASFAERWKIEGVLTARTPFHIGNGDKVDDSPPKSPRIPPAWKQDARGNDVPRRVEVSAVVTDHRGKPYVPATALKGNLRAWLTRNMQVPERVRQLFGSDDPQRPDAVGGKLEFLDAMALDPENSAIGSNVPYWDPDRQTGVAVSVALDRRTRTADDRKLYHEEFVPPGARFQVVITGQGLDLDDIKLVLLALRAFEHPNDPVRIGAGAHNGRGNFDWKPTTLHRLDKSGVAHWLAEAGKTGAEVVAYDGKAMEEVLEVEWEAIKAQVETSFQAVSGSRSLLVLKLELQFEGPFLVNDPSQTKPRKAPKSNPRANHAPRRDQQGRVVLPSKSMRGAFRSQAERIVRTLNPLSGGDPLRPQNGCDAIAKKVQAADLSLIAQVFGAPGWVAPIEFSDFRATEDIALQRQEFVAIDRFTGGASGAAKFNADFAPHPRLTGTIGVDLDRIEPCALGLLALTMRDLIDGDITFGFGAAKGYGACTARVARIWCGPIRNPRLQQLQQRANSPQIVLDSEDLQTLIGPEVKSLLEHLLDEFLEVVARPH